MKLRPLLLYEFDLLSGILHSKTNQYFHHRQSLLLGLMVKEGYLAQSLAIQRPLRIQF